MAKYKLLEKAFIHNRLYDPAIEGQDVVEVSDDTIPGPHMVPLDAAAKKAAKEVGLVNGPIPDPINEITMTEAERLGASPQAVKSGMAAGMPA
jgi:hypothetical protein